MPSTQEFLRKLKNHWALSAFSEQQLDASEKLIRDTIAKEALKDCVQFEGSSSLSPEQIEQLRRVALAYEIAALEDIPSIGLKKQDDDESLYESASYYAYMHLKILPIPVTTEEKIFHILRLGALAYCSDQWLDFQRWIDSHDYQVCSQKGSDYHWDKSVLIDIYQCWILLFRKKTWSDIASINTRINSLRDAQKRMERGFLTSKAGRENQVNAVRLIALYHWASVTDKLSQYLIRGEPTSVLQFLEKHFIEAIKAIEVISDVQLELLVRWLQVVSVRMVKNSVWWNAIGLGSSIRDFVKNLTKANSMFELLPPQKAAIREQGLMDMASTSVVIDLPTSGGKTLLAEFRMLQSLDLFKKTQGWVAYVAPTRALVSQVTRRLRRDLAPLGVKITQISGAIEIDSLEREILTETEENSTNHFDVLVTTPEKLQLIIRNKTVKRPLILLVMDEAHNIENENRGLRIELLLATIKADSPDTSFLLLMPFVEKAYEVAKWLSKDEESAKTISLGTVPWRPNDSIVGIFCAKSIKENPKDWVMSFSTSIKSRKAEQIEGDFIVGDVNPNAIKRSEVLTKKGQKAATLQTALMAQVFSKRGTSIAIALNSSHVWSMARKLSSWMPKLDPIPEEIRLVQKFLLAEYGKDFDLIQMLEHGIGVHLSGLSDDARTLIEWLAEKGILKVLCSTTTIVQGINYPVSSVFLASTKYPYGQKMTPREFWNLAGRAGRVGQDSIGVIGVAKGNEDFYVEEFISSATGELVSRIQVMLEKLEKDNQLVNFKKVFMTKDWEDFRSYVAHLCHEKEKLDVAIHESEQLLKNTLGYRNLEVKSPEISQQLLDVTKEYIEEIGKNLGLVSLADLTGFSPEGVSQALNNMHRLENRLESSFWMPESIFGNSSAMKDLYGVMLSVPQLKEEFKEKNNKKSFSGQQLANMTKDWVRGCTIAELADKYLKDGKNDTERLTQMCKVLYKKLLLNASWGISALTQMSGVNYEDQDEAVKRSINLIPAMIYHGVSTEEAVLMRMNDVPRAIAGRLGELMKEDSKDNKYSLDSVRLFLENSSPDLWNRAVDIKSPLSGKEYKKVWEILSGYSR